MSPEILIVLIAACLSVSLAQEVDDDLLDDRCAEGWYALDNRNANPFRCGRFIGERKPYDDAMSQCAQDAPGRNGQLVVIQDKGTNNRVDRIIKNANRQFPVIAWIGLRLAEARNEGDERLWKWRNSGRLRGYDNWAPNTPNNANQKGGQDCVYINDYRKRASWNDFECDSWLQFVCQYEA